MLKAIMEMDGVERHHGALRPWAHVVRIAARLRKRAKTEVEFLK